MEMVYRSQCGRFTGKFEGTQQEIFEQIAAFQEVFEGNECVSPKGTKFTDIRFRVRTDDEDNKYYEKVCMNYSPSEDVKYRKLSFGCHKKGGGLFPKPQKDDGKYVGWNGWVKYDKKTDSLV